MELAHDRAGNRTYNDEAALSYGIQYAMYAAQKYYTILPEADTGKGFADLLLIPTPKYPDKPALVIELKHNKDADGAIAQIKDRNYPAVLLGFESNILLVGISYDKESKKHHCVIEKL